MKKLLFSLGLFCTLISAVAASTAVVAANYPLAVFFGLQSIACGNLTAAIYIAN
jgi:hypothetical protein